MKKIFLAFSVLSIAISCTEAAKQINPEVVNTASALIIGDALDCGFDSLTIFPVGCSYSPEIVEAPMDSEFSAYNETLTQSSDISFSANSGNSSRYDKNAKIEYNNSNQNDFDIRNLIFYNLITGKSYPLVNDSIHILSFAIHKEYGKGLIFYRVVKENYNGDAKFDSFDPVILYISDLNGSNFTQITPPGEYFVDYTLYERTNSILIKSMIDANDDLKFLKDDETNYRSMILSQPKFAENLFNSVLKDTLRKYN